MNPRVQGRRGPLWSIQPHRPAALVAGRSVIYSRLPSTSPTLFGSSVLFTGLGDPSISDSSYLCASFHRYPPHPPHPPLNMASRQAAGARPGARFAQFKLVLLGTFFRRLDLLSLVFRVVANMSFLQESLPLERFGIPLAIYSISR